MGKIFNKHLPSDYADIIIKDLKKDIEDYKERAVNSSRLLVKKIEELKQREKNDQQEIKDSIKLNENLIELIQTTKEELEV